MKMKPKMIHVVSDTVKNVLYNEMFKEDDKETCIKKECEFWELDEDEEKYLRKQLEKRLK